jgi:hypothetical protein
VWALHFAAVYLSAGRLTAGRWLWLGGLLYTLFFVGSMAAQFILLALRNPVLLRERTATAGNAKRWDRVLIPRTVVVLPLVALVVAGLDTRFGWTEPLPPIVLWITAALGIGAYSLTLVSMMSNLLLSRPPTCSGDGRFLCILTIRNILLSLPIFS